MKQLKFEETVGTHSFLIEFESMNEHNNTLKAVLYNGFHLETMHLAVTHPALYSSIQKKMLTEADSYWHPDPDSYRDYRDRCEVNDNPLRNVTMREMDPVFQQIFQSFNFSK